VDEGLDIKLLNFTSARLLAGKIREKVGAKLQETFKVVGRDRSGKRKSKLTISVRIPKFKVGDILLLDDKPAMLVRITGKKAVFKIIGEDRFESIPVDELWGNRVKELPEDTYILKGILAYRDESSAYIMDPSNIERTFKVPLSSIPQHIKIGGEIRVLIVKGKPYVLD